MSISDQFPSLSRKEARMAVDRGMGLSLVACVGGFILRCWPLHRLAGTVFLGLVGVHLAQHEKWLRRQVSEDGSRED